MAGRELNLIYKTELGDKEGKASKNVLARLDRLSWF